MTSTKTIGTAQQMMTRTAMMARMATCNNVDEDGDNGTDKDIDDDGDYMTGKKNDDGDGATGDDNDDNGNGMTGNKLDDNGNSATGKYDDYDSEDDGNGCRQQR